MTFRVGVFHPKRRGIRKILGDLEAEIMEIIWRHSSQGMTVRAVFEILSSRRRLAYTTVMTTMARLARKGLLRARKGRAAYTYSPAFTRVQFVSRVVDRILEDLLVGFAGPEGRHLDALDPKATTSARLLLRLITRRRRQEER